MHIGNHSLFPGTWGPVAKGLGVEVGVGDPSLGLREKEG